MRCCAREGWAGGQPRSTLLHVDFSRNVDNNARSTSLYIPRIYNTPHHRASANGAGDDDDFVCGKLARAPRNWWWSRFSSGRPAVIRRQAISRYTFHWINERGFQRWGRTFAFQLPHARARLPLCIHDLLWATIYVAHIIRYMRWELCVCVCVMNKKKKTLAYYPTHSSSARASARI